MDADWIEQGVLDVIKLKYWSFIPRRGSGRREERADPPRPGPGRDRQGRATARRSAEEELTALFAETRPGGDRGHAPGRRRAAPRARGRDGHLRREPQHQRLERLHRRAARSAGSARAGARPTPTSTTARSSSGACARRWSTAPPRSACSRASTPTGGSRTTSTGCAWSRRRRPQIHLHAYSPMEVAHMCDVSGLGAARGVRAAAGRRPRAPPRARPRRCSTTACASGSRPTSCRWRAGSR